jgi:phosphatidylserine/phosphatidylglycerophosphate/cardiolipin synthase-like enzyme
MLHRYGPNAPWHDAMVEIRGPAVADVECCVRERWEDLTAPRHARPWLWTEHLGRSHDHAEDVIDPVANIAVLRAQADRLDAWQRAVEPLVRTVIDPDGRPWQWRRRDQ